MKKKNVNVSNVHQHYYLNHLSFDARLMLSSPVPKVLNPHFSPPKHLDYLLISGARSPQCLTDKSKTDWEGTESSNRLATHARF